MAKAIGRDYGDKSCKGRMAETLLKRYYVTNITALQGCNECNECNECNGCNRYNLYLRWREGVTRKARYATLDTAKG